MSGKVRPAGTARIERKWQSAADALVASTYFVVEKYELKKHASLSSGHGEEFGADSGCDRGIGTVASAGLRSGDVQAKAMQWWFRRRSRISKFSPAGRSSS